MSRRPISISAEQIKDAIANTNSAIAAASYLGMRYTTYIRYAKKYGVHVTNQGLRGTSKPSNRKIPLCEILKDGVKYKSSTLKYRLIKEGLKLEQCEDCKIGPFWNNKPLVLQLDHIDGNSHNNEITNLRLLCPNCHSQTSTFCRGFRPTGKRK